MCMVFNGHAWLEKPERFIWCVIRAKNHTHVFDIVLNGMHTHGLGLIQKVTHGFAYPEMAHT